MLKITKKGFLIMQARYKKLKSLHKTTSREVTKTARQGDLRENWGYTVAMDDWRKTTQELNYLGDVMHGTHILISKKDIKDHSKVAFSAIVELKMPEQDKIVKFQIVSQKELLYTTNGLPENNLMVQQALGSSEGDEIRIKGHKFIVKKITYED